MLKCPVCFCGDICDYLKVQHHDYVACTSCRAVFLTGIDEEEQTRRHSEDDYKRARILAESQHARHNQWLVDAMRRVRPFGKVLDVGCGSGFLVRAMRDSGYDAIGVDLGDPNRRFATEQLGVTVLNQDFLTMTGEYDIVTMHQLIEHLPDPGSFVQHARQLLKTRGYLILSTPNLAVARKLAQLPKPILGDALGHPPNHCVLFEPRTIRWLLETKGFNVEAVRNNPTGLMGNSRMRHFADRIMEGLGIIGPNMIAIASRK